ncbi:dihydroorotate dehydrogenase electron transfer subunit [Infirmifilum lucidum]|uniref:Dihydroorotate dehydrogenase electron transfer subunit n=1 Tax=Infirmifilum lucidum TaxID=2776706 RepID=A0A7L9FIH7_9CREN|nr:dihydroorotate dehydrogenase electron transfer subunit [Infirmifilum lucidum]QOJ79162.1 dihydroorotate dehydrogenase electron transfer subunit [Infirmifilum lucidum]
MHLRALVVESERVGSTTLLTLSVELSDPEPGQFVMLWVPGVGEIPLSVADYSDGNLLLAVTRKGRVTSYIYNEVRKGGKLYVRGPYGRPFTRPPPGSRALLVGGGSGVAPLNFLARKIREAGASCTAVLGYRTAEEVFLAGSFSRNCHTIVSTDDGSLGVRGLATDVASQLLSSNVFERIYACGPEPLIEKMLFLSTEKGLYFEASMERYMRCAVGVCGSCVLEPVGLRVCRDGPVFSGEVLKKVFHR